MINEGQSIRWTPNRSFQPTKLLVTAVAGASSAPIDLAAEPNVRRTIEMSSESNESTPLKILIIMALLSSLVACQGQSQKAEELNSIEVTFLTRPGCPKSPVMFSNLNSALGDQGIAVAVATVDLGKLEKDDYRTGYGTPTVLVNDKDLFGMDRPVAATPM
jgi:hypothetical protein